MTDRDRVVVVGAGIGGLVAALELASRGLSVVVVERAEAPGGKMREVQVGGAAIDAGPTVLTMRWVLDEVFASAGARLDDYLKLSQADVLARHAWEDGSRLDLYSDIDRTVDAISRFADAAEGSRYRAFCRQAQQVYEVLENSFIQASAPSMPGLLRRVGIAGLPALAQIKPYTSLWAELGKAFRDPRLRQLFGRYATYCGSSPLLAPATLMLIAHVERTGVWTVDGGMHRVAAALAELCRRKGVQFRFGTPADQIVVNSGRVAAVRLASGEVLACGGAVVNADAAAVAAGLLGRDIMRAVPRTEASARSLSAVTFAALARTRGFPLVRHNIFFGPDSETEFKQLFEARRVPNQPTVYICAQDRPAHDDPAPSGPERLLFIVNAPALGDTRPLTELEIAQCRETTTSTLRRCGLEVDLQAGPTLTTTPTQFDRLFPGTGGALYGQASHGWLASFQRPAVRTKIPGLFLAGGSTHPGAGVPMAAISGRQAAAGILADRGSTGRSHRAVIAGGISML